MSYETSPPPSLPDDPADSVAAERSPVISATLSLDGFIGDWPHCQHVADDLARFAASDRFDPEQLTTRLSTYLNEVLELVYRCQVGPPAGDLVIAIHRAADRLFVEVAVPIAADAHARLRHHVRRAGAPEAAAAYRQAFAGELADAEDDGAGLLELVALHGVTFALRETDERVAVIMSVPQE
jgi:hypothetical protein